METKIVTDVDFKATAPEDFSQMQLAVSGTVNGRPLSVTEIGYLQNAVHTAIYDAVKHVVVGIPTATIDPTPSAT